jgi:hypothetical protein
MRVRSLPFVLEVRNGVPVVLFDDGSCRPASGVEMRLWDALQRFIPRECPDDHDDETAPLL